MAQKGTQYSCSMQDCLYAGFDCVISTVGTPSVESQYIMLEAALRAGVQRFIPSSWGFDFDKLPCALSHTLRILTLPGATRGHAC